MHSVDDAAAGPHDMSPDHERIVLQARGLRFMYSVDLQLPSGTKPRWRDWFAVARRGLVPAPFEFVPAVTAYYRPGSTPPSLSVSPAARATH